MSKFSIGLLALVVLVVSFGCKDDPVEPTYGDVTLVFKGTFGEDPLVMFNSYNYAFDQKIQFTKSDFYLSHFKLVESNGTELELVDVDLVDLTYTSEADAITGYEITIKDVLAKTYTRLDFSIGLDPEDNATKPEDHPAGDPLALPRYWDGWDSYIFAKTEGNLDTGNAALDLGWVYHTGTDPLYAVLSASAQIPIAADQTTRIVFSMDHENLLGVGTTDGAIDIKSSPINHTPSDTSEIKTIVTNYATSFTYIIE